MTDVFNPVWPGYPYQLPMSLDPANMPVGGHLRIDLHGAGVPRRDPIKVTLTEAPAGTHTLALTAAQTAPLRGTSMLVGDLVVHRADGTEYPLNLRLSIPVEDCLTAAEPA